MKWTDVPAGIINAAQQRLWVALGDAADVVANNIVENPSYLDSVARVLMSGVAVKEEPKVEQPKLEPTIIELGEFEVNYDETIASKIAGNADPKRIGWHNCEWATDEKFPDKRKRKKRFKASAVNFGKLMPDDGEGSVAQWCKDNKKIRATPKEGIDLALANPRPKLDKVMPLALAGQFFVDADGYRRALFFYLFGGERHLSDVWLVPDEQWHGHWWFLVLEELPSET